MSFLILCNSFGAGGGRCSYAAPGGASFTMTHPKPAR
jgi:hypothetical protein